MARTTAERLTFLLELRDTLEDAIATSGGQPVTVMIRQRSVTYASPQATLDYVSNQIKGLQSITTKNGGSKNRVRLEKP